MVKKYLFLILILIASGSFANSDKAITDVSSKKGIKLSAKAKNNIGFKTIKLGLKTPFEVPGSCIVHSKDKVGVYRIKDEWIKFEIIKVISQNTSTVVFSGPFTSGEEIVSEGAPLVRVSEMEAFASEEL